jgi:hypothetical protein
MFLSLLLEMNIYSPSVGNGLQDTLNGSLFMKVATMSWD